MVSFPTVNVGYFYFSVIFHIEVQVNAACSFARGIDIELQAVVTFPVHTSYIIRGHASATSQPPAENLLRMGRSFQTQAMLARLAPFISQTNLTDALVRPFGEILHITQHHSFQHFLFQAECLESLCLVERQRTVHVTRTDDVGFQLFIYLGMKPNSRGTKQTGQQAERFNDIPHIQ